MRNPIARLIRAIAALPSRIAGDRRGSVFIILGFALIPLTFSVGMGIDYARAARMQTRLNALADAAALATVTNPMMQQSQFNAAVTSYYMWYQQANGTSGMLTPYNTGCCAYSQSSTVADVADGTLHIVITDSGTTGHSRTTTVSWHAASKNSFGTLLNMPQIELSGTSTTSAKQAPNIDFYLLIDSSGSMAFPATSAGITQLRSVTGGCAFACHSTNDAQARTQSGTMADYYTVANSYNIPLRITEARNAVQSMMTTANQTQQNNQATYQAALYSFAAGDARARNSFQKLAPTTGNVTPALSTVSTAANGIQTSLYYSNNCPTSSYCNGDADTASSDAFTRMNAAMPAPGNGTNQSGDTPQEIMFIITDGMRDETRSIGRPEVAFDTSMCNTIKARGIRIGIIYTEFLQSSMDGDGWSQTNVVPYLPQVEPALQTCASPGLYYKVTTDQDISAALNQLFQAAVATAHITK